MDLRVRIDTIGCYILRQKLIAWVGIKCEIGNDLDNTNLCYSVTNVWAPITGYVLRKKWNNSRDSMIKPEVCSGLAVGQFTAGPPMPLEICYALQNITYEEIDF